MTPMREKEIEIRTKIDSIRNAFNLISKSSTADARNDFIIFGEKKVDELLIFINEIFPLDNA